MMVGRVVVQPAAEPVTLDEAREHCRVDSDHEDIFLINLIVTAREYCEEQQRRSYVLQTREVVFDGWPCFPVELPAPPLLAVESVKFYGADGIEHTFDPSSYFVDIDSEPGRIIRLGSLPSTALRVASAVKIRYQAGYHPDENEKTPDYAANIPRMVKQAILLLVGHWYTNREAVGKVTDEIKFSVNALLAPKKVWSL